MNQKPMGQDTAAMPRRPQKEATPATAKANQSVYAHLDFDDEREFECARRGLIAAPEQLTLKSSDGRVVWSQSAYAFLDGNPPDTANPSLWRNAQLNHLYGLFEVMDGIYQVRGYDMSNITFIQGYTGWIVFDPLMTIECSRAAKELVDQKLGVKPIRAIVYSHTHVDHYGGVKGIVSEDQVRDEKITIIAPEGFEEYVVKENLHAGAAMARRASYQYGTMLEPGPKGRLSIGIGMTQSKGTTSYISPNLIIQETGQKVTVDGVTMEFQLTPGTEAPAEMNTWIPAKKALWLAENCSGTLHNLYTLRGAQVRDAAAWSGYLMEALALYGGEAEVVFQAHNWPHWGNETIRDYITQHALAYKFIHDQTLHYLNLGYTPIEIARRIELPPALAKSWYTRQYYGTVAHNSRAVYDKYMGWYDANPVNLNPLEPTESATKLVEYLGSPERVIEKAREDFDRGQYQWVAQIMNALVFANPKNQEARDLEADALEQLAYQAESGPWRNVYLSAAHELRDGSIPPQAIVIPGGKGDIARAQGTDLMLAYLGICLDPEKTKDLSFTANLTLTDTGEKYTLVVRSGVLLPEKGVHAAKPDVTWTMPRVGLNLILQPDAAVIDKVIQQTGDKTCLQRLSASMTVFTRFFNIIEP